MSGSWQCPYCGEFQILTHENKKFGKIIKEFVKISEYDNVGLGTLSIACLNPKCRKLTLAVQMAEFSYHNGQPFFKAPKKEWQLLPDSMAKPQPEYIPESIRQDYEEACKIESLSPKASATLARRCLQGMIRDFCKISDSSLHREIEELRVKFGNNEFPQDVTNESIEAIDNARKVGNIGAHMEKDINLIVDIEQDEARVLIKLIEVLFDQWYVSQHKREKIFQNLKEITKEKMKKRQKNSSATKQE